MRNDSRIRSGEALFVRFCPTLRLSANRNARGVVAGPDPAVLSVARRWIAEIFFFEARQLVGLDGVSRLFHIDAEELGGIQAENLIFDGVGQLGVLEFVTQLV